MSAPHSTVPGTVTRVAHEFLKESRKLRGSASAASPRSDQQRMVSLEETVRTLEARIAVLEQSAAFVDSQAQQQQDLLLKKAETVVQALLLENQRLRGVPQVRRLPSTLPSPSRSPSSRTTPPCSSASFAA